MDLNKLGFKEKGKKNNGRPAYPPSALLKLYIYGYLNRVRSSRRLEREACTNVEAMWLLRGLRPCYKTIADFRKEHVDVFKKVFNEFNLFLRGEGLLSGDTVATDGTKIRAQNSKKNNYTEKKIKQHQDYIGKQINSCLKEMEELDKGESNSEIHHEQSIELAAKLDQLCKRKEKYEELEEKMKVAHEQGQTQISTSDPDARALPKKMNIVEVGYNAVVTAEADNKLLTNYEIRNTHDTYALSEAGIAAREALGKKEGEEIKQLADKGFDTGSELKKCAENNISTYVSPKKRVHAKKDKRFNKDQFVYDKKKDVYICPEGEELSSNGKWYHKNNGKLRQAYKVKHYKSSYAICKACPHRMECAGKANLDRSKGRYIERSEYQEYVDDNIERVKLNKELYRKRQQIIEHPFGTIKRQWGYDYTLLKGLEKVEGEFGIIFTCYNLRRAITIFGVQELIKRLRKSLFLKKWKIKRKIKRFADVFCGELITPRLKYLKIKSHRINYFNSIAII
ncbi:MAG TPA: IS1182 family transposase [Flavobacteriia bacterium]|nr:IS1182 family transposase [Flavobacteriia bacterium]